MKENRMQRSASGSAVLVLIILLAGVALAVANVATLAAAVKGAVSWPALVEAYQLCVPCFIYFAAAPLLFAIGMALVARRRPAPAAAATQALPTTEPAAAPPSPAPALRLLSVLQQEGRLIDFIQEDIDGYSDAQVGAAVRSIHSGCRKALQDRIELQRIFGAEDGSEVVVDKNFDPATVRLTGNVSGQPPFRGVLQHGGWRATKVALPESPGGVDPHVIAPAEVEIP
jgi:hypothetical protein